MPDHETTLGWIAIALGLAAAGSALALPGLCLCRKLTGRRRWSWRTRVAAVAFCAAGIWFGLPWLVHRFY